MLKLKRRERAMNQKKTPRAQARSCNLCGDTFVSKMPHACFCEACKKEHELYKFADWLPDLLVA